MLGKETKKRTADTSKCRAWPWIVGIVGILTIIAFVVLHLGGSSTPTSQTSTGETSTSASEESGISVRVRERPRAGTDTSVGNRFVNPEALLAQQLIAKLAQFDQSKRAITQEDVRKLDQTFKDLVAQGPAAIPAIRDFLGRNEDLNFSDLGGATADYSSMRMGLIDALKQIGGPDALETALQTLKVTADPREVAVLSRDLEQQSPGQYRQEAISAARESLARALEGGLGERDVAPLFQVLQSYGDSSVIPDLVKALPQWSYYGSLTLANLPDGQGIPALISQLDDPAAAANGQSDIALQVLAQVSVAQPQASEALLSMAKQNRISDTAWAAVALALAGHNFEMGTPLQDKTLTPPGGLKSPGTVRLDENGQTLFTTPVSASWLDEQISSRLKLIDQMLEVSKSPAGTQALQQARQSLDRKATELSMLPH